MDDRKVGLIARALRRRRGWRQIDLAAAARCSQGTISLVERGHLDRVSLRVIRRILAALEASALIEIRWRGAALDRLLDEEHAMLLGVVAERLRRVGWSTHSEVTYSEFGERGSYDILAFHPATGIVLVIEIKTDLASVEATLRKIDEKVRLAPKVAGQRFGWRANHVARVLVMPDTRTLRRRVDRHARVVGQALPSRSVAVRRWVEAPSGTLAGLWFLSVTNGRSARQQPGGPERIRRPRSPARNDGIAAITGTGAAGHVTSREISNTTTGIRS